MFGRQRPESEAEITRALRALGAHEVGSKEYAQALECVVKLHRMRVEEKSAFFVSSDTLALVGANLLGIFMIIRHEQVNVITTKALGFVFRMR